MSCALKLAVVSSVVVSNSCCLPHPVSCPPAVYHTQCHLALGVVNDPAVCIYYTRVVAHAFCHTGSGHFPSVPCATLAICRTQCLVLSPSQGDVSHRVLLITPVLKPLLVIHTICRVQCGLSKLKSCSMQCVTTSVPAGDIAPLYCPFLLCRPY